MESTPSWGGPWLLALLSHLAAGAQAQGSQGPGRDGAEAGGARRQGLGCRVRQPGPRLQTKVGTAGSNCQSILLNVLKISFYK